MKVLLLCVAFAATGRGDSLAVMFWNLENFFDWKNDSLNVSDAEFSSRGERRWTRRRFCAKAGAIAKTILWTEGAAGRLPDIIGVAEVENGFVLRLLLKETILRKLDYAAVHFDSPDPRGIDVGLLYRRSVFDLERARQVPVGGGAFRTRDILLAELVSRRSGRRYCVLVNHHPSKYGGTKASDGRRKAAVETLRRLADSLSRASPDIIAMGDFNDTPDAPLFNVLSPPLVNLSAALARRGEGSIRYDGHWELIDLFFVSESLSEARVAVLKPPFLMQEDRAHGGYKPLRTYSGPRYLGGVSDHLPVLLLLPP